MHVPVDTQPDPWLRILHAAPVRMALFHATLAYLYLSGSFFRVSFTHSPLQALAATVMAATLRLVVHSSLVVHIERRAVSELALAPMARELGLGLLLGFALYSTCVLVLTALGNDRVDGLACSACRRSGSAPGWRC